MKVSRRRSGIRLPGKVSIPLIITDDDVLSFSFAASFRIKISETNLPTDASDLHVDSLSQEDDLSCAQGTALSIPGSFVDAERAEVLRAAPRDIEAERVAIKIIDNVCHIVVRVGNGLSYLPVRRCGQAFVVCAVITVSTIAGTVSTIAGTIPKIAGKKRKRAEMEDLCPELPMSRFAREPRFYHKFSDPIEDYFYPFTVKTHGLETRGQYDQWLYDARGCNLPKPYYFPPSHSSPANGSEGSLEHYQPSATSYSGGTFTFTPGQTRQTHLSSILVQNEARKRLATSATQTIPMTMHSMPFTVQPTSLSVQFAPPPIQSAPPSTQSAPLAVQSAAPPMQCAPQQPSVPAKATPIFAISLTFAPHVRMMNGVEDEFEGKVSIKPASQPQLTQVTQRAIQNLMSHLQDAHTDLNKARDATSAMFNIRTHEGPRNCLKDENYKALSQNRKECMAEVRLNLNRAWRYEQAFEKSGKERPKLVDHFMDSYFTDEEKRDEWPYVQGFTDSED